MVQLKGDPVDLTLPENFNLSEHLVDRHVHGGRGDSIAYIQAETGVAVTYSQLLERISKAGNGLLDLDVEIEDRIGMILPDSIEYVEALLGAIRIGAQPVLLSTLESPQFYEFVLNDCLAKVLIVHANLFDKVRQGIHRLEHLKSVVVVGGVEGIEDDRTVSYERIVGSASGVLQAEQLHRDDFCYWQYSSGTTGSPKGVIHYQHDPVYSCETYYRHILQMSSKDINFSTSKIFFAYGLGNTVWAPLYFGASAVLMSSPPDPEFVLKTIERFGVTLFFSVPVFYSRILAYTDSHGAANFNLSSVRYCVSAGEALPASIYYRWKEYFGKDILDGIGTTEMCHIFVSNRPDKIKPGTSGVVVPGYEVKIVDDQMREVGYGEAGRLLVKGGSTAAMYWRRHEKTKEHFLGEWFYTGDLYVADTEGFLKHVGRADDLIKSGGVWVSPVEVESAILSHPAVLECAVVQGYTADGLGRPKAYVVLKSGYAGSDELADEIKKHVLDKLGASYKAPTWVIFTGDLPKTPTGKIQRFKLREVRPPEVSA
ncbi:MAG: benzoate-CoA ligase family protein [Nitrososphaerota archaeon]|nr:benzoate-CoA ligase family protein [Nitrososphaerota archaeon]